MSEVTHILNAIEHGHARASEQLLAAVYDELRRLAAHQLAQEAPGQTLEATALVHEAYIRLLDSERRGSSPPWQNRRHFFAAAAEAMRRILIENARRKARDKRGGGLQRVDLDPSQLATTLPAWELICIHDALECLARDDPKAADLVKLRYYAGLSVEEAAEMAGLGRSTAYEHWAYARAWLRRHFGENDDAPGR
jgi:RNA polymerase sigma factor (TIGR02999 family)